MSILDHIRAEWDVLKGAPMAFTGLLALGVIGGFGGGCLFMSQQLANMQSLVDLKDGQIDAYQKSINERLDKVEKQLSAQQLSSLQETLKTNPSRVGIATGPTTTIYETQLFEAFKDSGWGVFPKEVVNPKGTTVLHADDAKSAMTIGQALEKAGLKFETVDGGGTVGATDFYLSVPK